MAADGVDGAEVGVCESWEDMDDSGLEQLKFLSITPAARNTLCKVNILPDESSAQYMMPEPAIRILKRPESRGDSSAGEIARRPVKTLEQRQKEYEEARLRILGEARSPEDVVDDKLNRLQDKLQASSVSQPVRVKERPVPTATPVIGNTVQSPPPGVLVLRAPKAPDGTRGFAANR